MAKKNTNYRIGTGATSLLMLLVILCLTILSAICYTSASSQKRLRERVSVVQHDISNAENQAQTMVADIDALIAHSFSSQQDYLAEIERSITASGLPVQFNDGVISFSIAANENLSLEVQLAVNGPDSASRYSIIRYATCSTNSEDNFEDEPLNLMK